jgi:hypothetical protein
MDMSPMSNESPEIQETQSRLPTRLETIVILPNLALLAFVILYVVTHGTAGTRVEQLVVGDKGTTARIAELELALRRQPRNISSAIELARLYREAGEFPWSYNALRNAEKTGKHDPAWKLMLGLAYLELGKNDDGVRVLDATLKECTRQACSAATRAKLEIFARIGHLLEERGIDARSHNKAAEKALHEVLKPVEVNPEMMRPKAPADPKSAPTLEKGDPT